MATNDGNVHVGNIATYEDASDEFLRRRKEDLRVKIRNPVLSAGEFVREVATHAFVASVALGISLWTGIKNAMHYLIRHSEWFASKMTINQGQIAFMKDSDGYEAALEHNAQNFATFFGFEAQRPALQVAEQILKDTTQLQHTGFNKQLRELIEHTLSKSDIPEPAKQKALVDLFKKVHETDPQAHIGQYWVLWREMARIEKEGGKGPSSTRFANEAFHNVGRKIIESGERDNLRIVNKYRIPATIGAVAVAGLFTGYQGYRAARRQKSLDQSQELTHIERLQSEREQRRGVDPKPAAAIGHAEQAAAARESAGNSQQSVR